MPNNDQVFLYMKEEIEREAATQENRLLEEAQELREKAKEEIKLEVVKEIQARFDKELAALQLKSTVASATDATKQRQELINLRDGYVKTVFEGARAKLIDFTNSEKYEEFLLSKVKAAAQNHNFDEAQILVSEKDKKYEAKILSAYGLKAEVVVSEKLTIGGFILLNPKTNVVIDNSLSFILDDQMAYFTKNSGLIIK
ncbi:MAG: V-type ATP synthase subunit E [Erysipelotrichaceae bacterium]|nr:V-type ATP synthase subunit E [Erysipelotrichaceae bacterium]